MGLGRVIALGVVAAAIGCATPRPRATDVRAHALPPLPKPEHPDYAAGPFPSVDGGHQSVVFTRRGDDNECWILESPCDPHRGGRWAPLDQPDPPGPRFDSRAAAQQLARVAVDTCRTEGGPTGRGYASIVFQNDGHVHSVTIHWPFARTPVAACIAEQFSRVEVPPFGGGRYTTTKSFVIPE